MPQLPLEILDTILEEHFLIENHHDIPVFLHISQPFRSLAKRRIFQDVRLEYPDHPYPPAESRSERLLDLILFDPNIPSYVRTLSITLRPPTNSMGAAFSPKLSASQKAADEAFVDVLDTLAAEAVGLTTLRLGRFPFERPGGDTTTPLDTLPSDVLRALVGIRSRAPLKHLHFQCLSQIPWSLLMGDWEGDEVETVSLETCSTQAAHWQMLGSPMSPSGSGTDNSSSSPGGNNVFVDSESDNAHPPLVTLSPASKSGALGPLGPNINDQALIGSPASPFMRLKCLTLTKTTLGFAEFNAPPLSKSSPRQTPATSKSKSKSESEIEVEVELEIEVEDGTDALRFPSLESVSLEVDLIPVVVKNASWILERCLVLKDLSLGFSFSQQTRVKFTERVKQDQHVRRLGTEMGPYTFDSAIPSLASLHSLTLKNQGSMIGTADFKDLLRFLEINMPLPHLRSLTIIGLLEQTMLPPRASDESNDWVRLEAVLVRGMPSLVRLHLVLCFWKVGEDAERDKRVERAFGEWGVRFSFGGRVAVTREIRKC